jgi:N-hydroxyarylamine O-acetyltransferase
METSEVKAYLDRIGAEASSDLDEGRLRQLQRRHLLSVPFENLSIHLGEPIVLSQEALVDKLVHRRRGGFCYELNGGFGMLLAALGYRVTMLAARVIGRDGLGPPYDHMALRVDLAEPWLVDVGFGKHSHYPLRLTVASDQVDPGGTFRVETRDEGDLDILMDGEPQYRLEPRARGLSDFEAMCWWHQTSPRSHFTQAVVCSRLTETGRVSMTNRTLIETDGADRRERTLASDEELLAAYRDYFDIPLDRVPEVNADRLQRL